MKCIVFTQNRGVFYPLLILSRVGNVKNRSAIPFIPQLVELEEEDDTLPGVAVVDPAPVAPDRVPVVNKELPPLSTPWYGLTEGAKIV